MAPCSTRFESAPYRKQIPTIPVVKLVANCEWRAIFYFAFEGHCNAVRDQKLSEFNAFMASFFLYRSTTFL